MSGKCTRNSFFLQYTTPNKSSSADPRLLGSGNSNEVTASPFVIFAEDARLFGFDSFLNFVILISVISIGSSGVYGGSRTIHALASEGYGPNLFMYIDRAGRPLPATLAILACGFLGFINLTASGTVIIEWLISLSGLAAPFTWASICLAHIRFRSAWKLQGHTLEEIPFRHPLGVWGSYLGLAAIGGVIMAQVFFPLFLSIPSILFCLRLLMKMMGLTAAISSGRLSILFTWKGKLAPRKISSEQCWRCLLYLPSGSLGTCGRGRDGRVLKTSTFILDVVSRIGLRSTHIGRWLRAFQLGKGCVTCSSER